MNKKIAILIVIVVAVGAVWFFFPKIEQNPQACTLEAKLCPDGSYVGRTGPNCEFTSCPGENR